MICQKIERYEDGKPVYRQKKSYETQDNAIEFAKFINSQDHVINKVVPYLCKVCNKYHLGRNGKPLTNKEREKRKKQLKYNL